MKQIDKQRANRILDLYLSCSDKRDTQEEVALRGPSDFEGDCSKSTKADRDTLGGKVDQMRRIYITVEEALAYKTVMALPYDLRLFVTLHRHIRNDKNPATGNCFNHEDCAKILGRSKEQYERAREVLLPHLIDAYSRRLSKSRPIKETTCSA